MNTAEVLKEWLVLLRKVVINVFKKFKLPRVSGGKKVRQRGQILLMYAFLIPMLFLFVGVTFDLSWYYINVSRMQNAADAAVIAGAQELIDDGQSLSEYNSTSFVIGFDGSKCWDIPRDTSTGDMIAKTYVKKNLAKDDASWEDNSILNFWTRNDVLFRSNLLKSDEQDFESLYYHVMIEGEVPHMFLNGWFPVMNAKVSSVAKITYYLKGYDVFHQMKKLGDKQTYLNLEELSNEKDFEPEAIKERAILSDVRPDDENNRRVEILDFTDKNPVQQAFDDLFTGFDLFAPVGSSNVVGSGTSYAIHRIINIDTTYPIRDYDFYMGNPAALEKLREENEDCKDLPSWELAERFAKEPPDPLYIRIETESEYDSVRQTIININVSNINEKKYRPLVLFYEGSENSESLPVILNLNADFRGILFAPNNSVVINGNGHEFNGFVIAESYRKLATEGGDYYTPIVDKHGNTIYVDDYGNVEYDNDLAGQNYFRAEDFNIGESKFDSFYLIKLEGETLSSDINFFTTAYANEIK
ncbi:MAG: pilus assembly protein [Selenomonadaceae bacterium]|nr:pilus assembly protein [Selenomonadaceae bacterium]